MCNYKFLVKFFAFYAKFLKHFRLFCKILYLNLALTLNSHFKFNLNIISKKLFNKISIKNRQQKRQAWACLLKIYHTLISSIEISSTCGTSLNSSNSLFKFSKISLLYFDIISKILSFPKASFSAFLASTTPSVIKRR